MRVGRALNDGQILIHSNMTWERRERERERERKRERERQREREREREGVLGIIASYPLIYLSIEDG